MTVKNDPFNTEFWLQNNIQEGHTRRHNHYWRSFTSSSRGWQFQFHFIDVNLLEFLAINEQTRDRLVSTTKKAKNLQMLIKLIKQGFSRPLNLNWSTCINSETTCQQRTIWYFTKTVFVLTSMRNDMKKKAHTSHLAVDSNIRCALDTIFWPGMSHELQECYMNCKQCSRYSAKNSKETLITRLVPEYPFQYIGLNTMTLDGKKYLVCVDYFSNYIMVNWLQGISLGRTVNLIRKHFMRYGIPEEVVSDGGPKFDDQMMRELAHKFKWNPSSSEMPNSNRTVESAVK